MILVFLPEASAELFEAAEYYESKQQGLGKRFRSEALVSLLNRSTRHMQLELIIRLTNLLPEYNNQQRVRSAPVLAAGLDDITIFWSEGRAND
jgi:hypothetical protein